MVRLLLAALVFLAAAPVPAEVHVERSTELVPDLESMRIGPGPSAKGNEPDDAVWFIPLFKARSSGSALAATTFFSIRNEGDFVTNVLVEYFDTSLTPPRQQAERFGLAPDQLVSRNVRDVEGLAVGRDGFARGIIRITPRADEPISVDVFQLDAVNNFAGGGPAFTAGEFCDFWQVRFLDFGGLTGGSVMTVLVNGARGARAGDPPTILGTVFNEQGKAINTFNVRTDEWALEIPLLDLVEGDETRFGSIELLLNATGNPGGVVSVTHSALGRFSIATQGVCKDGL